MVIFVPMRYPFVLKICQIIHFNKKIQLCYLVFIKPKIFTIYQKLINFFKIVILIVFTLKFIITLQFLYIPN